MKLESFKEGGEEMDKLIEYAEMFKILGHPVRLQILLLLREHQRLCVCEMLPRIRISQPNLSQHLSILRLSGLIESEKIGATVYYSLPENDFLYKLLDLLKVEQKQEVHSD